MLPELAGLSSPTEAGGVQGGDQTPEGVVRLDLQTEENDDEASSPISLGNVVVLESS